MTKCHNDETLTGEKKVCELAQQVILYRQN